MTIEDTLRRDLFKSKAKAGDWERKEAAPYDLDLDKHLVSSSKQVLLKHVDFQPAQQDVSFRLKNLRGKYVPLNSAKHNQTSKKSPNTFNKGKMDGPKTDGIPQPKQVLCKPDKIHLDWQKCHRVGSGLINMGNTCFLNATLQCLTYTPPLANFLLSRQHKEECRAYGFCILCDLCTHFQRAFQHHGQAIRPMNMIHKLKSIAKHMHIGRQEDAHEFLRYVIEAMQKSCLNGYDKLDRYSKETSPVHQIFGGYYRSRVICASCRGKSDTFDPFLDISLDIKHVPSVDKALQRLIQPETLDGDNAYQCKRCNRKVPAQKRFTVHRGPNILTLCLKRFEFNRFSMGKINKEVSFSEYLNLRPYMSENKGPPVVFQLYGLIKHEGGSCNSGHYYCYVRAPNQAWYCMNDSYVSQTSLNRVLNQNAYVLFYIRKPTKGSSGDHNQIHKDTPKTVTSPGITHKSSNPHQGPVGTPIARPKPSTTPKPSPSLPAKPSTPKPSLTPKPSTSTSAVHSPFMPKPKIIAEPEKKPHTFTPTSAKHNMPQMIPPPGKRDKLSFVIKSKGIGSTLQNLQKGQIASPERKPVSTPDKSGVLSPTRTEKLVKPPTDSGKLLQKSKNGTDVGPKKHKVSVKTEEENVLNKGSFLPNESKKRSSLVPYGDDDSSSSDSDYDDVVKRLSEGNIKEVGASTSSVGKTPGDLKGDADMGPPDSNLSAAEIGKKSALANSTNLTAIRKTDSPLKLTITTNGNAQRLKSTTPWRVTDSDQQVSPSVTSDSSNHSNQSWNSTSEWTINEKKEPVVESLMKEASHIGWKVEPSPCRNGNGQLRHGSGEESRIETPTKELFRDHKDSNGSVKNRTSTPFSPKAKEEKSLLSKREKLGIIPKQLNGKHEHSDRTKQSVTNSGPDAHSKDVSKENGKSVPHHHKEGQQKTEGDMKHSINKPREESQKKLLESSGLSEGSEQDEKSATKTEDNIAKGDESLKKKSKKRKHNHLEESNDEKEKTNGASSEKTDGDEDESKDKSEALPSSDAFRKYRGQHKSNDSDSDTSCDSQLKKGKNSGQPLAKPHHHKFPQPPQQSNSFCSPPGSDYEDDSLPVVPPGPRQWRNRRHSDQGYYNDRPYPLPPHNDQGGQCYGGPHGGPPGGPPSGMKRKKMMNGYGDSWEKPQQRRFSQPGYTQQWDHHIRDDGYQHQRPPMGGPGGHHKLSHSWDGTQRPHSHEVMDYFNKSSLKGYGTSVQSWDGGRSEVDEDVARDTTGMKRRSAWDEDFDRGKVKKVRKSFNQHGHFAGHHTHNPFQHAQNQRNKPGHRGGFHGYNQHQMKKSRSWSGGGGRPR